MEQTVEEKYKHAFHAARPEHMLPDDFAIRHPKMPLSQRAKIFSPFAALRGFEEAVDSKLERYVRKAELSDEDREKLNAILVELAALVKNGRQVRRHPVVVTVRYFVPCGDENHEAYGRGGRYETLRGTVRKIDPVIRKAIWVNESEIEFSDILEIKIEAPAEEGEQDVLPLLYGDVAAAAPDRRGRGGLDAVSEQY